MRPTGEECLFPRLGRRAAAHVGLDRARELAHRDAAMFDEQSHGVRLSRRFVFDEQTTPLAIDRGMRYGRQQAQEVAQRRVDTGSHAGELAPLLTLDQQLVGEHRPPDLAQPVLDPQRELGAATARHDAERGELTQAREQITNDFAWDLDSTIDSPTHTLRFEPPCLTNSSTKIGAGRTAAGTSYTVWLIRKKGGPAGVCKLRMEVRRANGVEPGILELLAGGPEVCLAPRGDRSETPSVICTEGLVTIKIAVPAATRTVDLRMSDGTQIVSRPVLVPRRLGGPGAREGRETCEGESEGAGPPPGGFGGTGETSRIVLNG